MGMLVVHQEKITDIKAMISICPFGAMEEKDGKLEVNSACKLCKLCVKKGQPGVMEYVEEETPQIDKSLWNGITVYVDHVDGEIHPVTYELLGKAKELAEKIDHPVYAIFMGSNVGDKAQELLHYGADKVFVCDKPELQYFKIETYTAVFEEFINRIKPCAILVGATPVGRQLAPRVAARFKTGLTADCTILDMHKNTDLVQIRPAFGGNIMAEILTPNSRPQLATVRYKIMDAPERSADAKGEIVELNVDDSKLANHVEVIGVTKKEQESGIENADILVVAGRGIKKREDLQLVQDLADALGGDLACTRPMVEGGWMDAKRQIGLSGRTVRPKLIITCGVSGAIQFVAGMNHSENIIAINTDPNASIFKVANYAVVGDLYDVVPKLIEKIKSGAALI
ncbi:MAG: electron transfer flavoprotein subunit alpha/FixB family protein [Selenomonadales bacterium]|jgi:electron transfer flavoprotein alpha subunit|nr:electron transfer flavoprotein subunit alpha/FixB family protein [Selenomonadales bacterium]MDY3740812.1 electron transfer flavoprotein subunit alpha/FixB family protein [Selenomonadaceae bacterium]